MLSREDEREYNLAEYRRRFLPPPKNPYIEALKRIRELAKGGDRYARVFAGELLDEIHKTAEEALQS